MLDTALADQQIKVWLSANRIPTTLKIADLIASPDIPEIIPVDLRSWLALFVAQCRREDAHDKFAEADNAWQVALDALFPGRASDARYTAEGRGVEGSALRALYEARTAAFEGWRKFH